MKFRLNKHKRLRSKTEFTQFFQVARKKEGDSYLLYYAPQDQGPSKVAFVAGKKVGGAVQRNKCKRRLRESYQHLHNFLPQNYSYVLIAKKKLLYLPEEERKSKLSALFLTIKP